MASTHLPSSYITAAQLASCIPSARSLEQQYPCLVLAAIDPPSHGYNQNTYLSAMQVPSSMILMNKEDDSSGYKGNPDWLSHGLPSQSMSPYVSLEQAFNDKQAQHHLASPIAINVLQSMSGKKEETNLPLPSEDAQGIGCLDGIETVINGMHEAWRMGNGLPNFVANTAQQNHWDSSLLPSIIPESTKGATKLSSFLGLKEAQNIKQEALLCQEMKLEQDQGHQCNSTEMAKDLHSYLTAKRIQSTEGIREQGCNSTKKRKTTGEDQSASTNPQSSIQASENAEMGNGKRSKNSKASKKCGGKEISETYNKSMKEQSSVSDSSTTSCEKQVNGKESQILKSPSAEVREAPKQDYIHVRARRGQATDSHSLAERVRREKISERMKLLQSLVPSCNKVAGKALVLDEIINYVQSLQHQVEFLSMKLAAMNPTEGYFENYFNPGEVHKFGQFPVISTHGQPAAARGMITLPEISSLSQHRYVHVDEFSDGATVNNDQILPETAGFMSTYLGW